MTSKTIDVKLLNKSFQIKCPADQVESLDRARRHLNEKMTAIYQKGHRDVGSIAVLAALNICKELFESTHVNRTPTPPVESAINLGELHKKVMLALDKIPA